MANLTITSVEGAVAVCQTTRSIEPLEQVIASLQGLSRSEAWSR
jgi:hypothetical protein